MKMRAAVLTIALAALSSASVAQAPVPAPPGPPPIVVPARPNLAFDPKIVPNPQAVLDVLDYTAAAQMASLDEKPFTIAYRATTQITANWVAAAFYVGASRLARVSDRSGALPWLRRIADHFNYAMRGTASPRNMINADDQAIGELYLELYARTGQEGMLLPTRQRLDYTIPWLTVTPEPKRLTWWWCDALFMAPPVMARMSVLTGDPKYIRAMDVQWWRTTERLWDSRESLYFRDERFIGRRSETGKKIFWGRGNGWVVGGMARVLESMPADFPTRPRHIANYRAMMKRLTGLQRADGLWPTSLLDEASIPGPEASGSAFNVYAMAWGINHGLLDRKTYLPHVLRGWAGLAAIIQPNGLLGYVQRTGDQPVPSQPGDHGFYGSGALLLAGLEVMRLGGPVSALPVPESVRDLAGPPRAPNAAPPPADPEARREYDRRQAEMRATRELGFDPMIDGVRP